MAADKSLKDLSNAVYKIAENSPKIQKDVKDIRDAVCGTDGILESLYVINKNIENSKKKDSLSKLSGKKSNDINNKLLKSTSSITSVLKNILDDVKKVSRRGDKKIQVNDVGKNNKPTVSLLRRILNAIKNISGRNSERRQESRRLERYPEDRRDRKIKGLETVSRSISIVERLKNIKLKDFLFANRKLKNLSKIMLRSLGLFRNFKNQKEAEGTVSLINSSIDIVKKLGKIWIISKPAQWGERAIEKIFLGDKKTNKGLLGLFRKINSNKRQIQKGKRTMTDILKSCGSFLLTTMILTGIAALSIPAMLGALLMKGVVHLLIGTYKVLSKSSKYIIKGSIALLILSSSVITFALGLGMMTKAIKDMKLKDIGLMIASITGVGLAVAGIGFLVVPIAIGSASLLLISASIGILGLALKAWKTIDAKSAMGNIKEAVGGLREIFGLELGKGDENKSFVKRLGGGLMDIAMGILNFGKSFFIMGSLLLAGATLGLLYHGLKRWSSFDGKSAANNIRTTIGALKDVFGLNEVQGGFGTKLKALGGGVLDLGIALLQSGKAFVQLGTLTVATAMMDVIRLTLKPWQKDFDARPAAKNIKITITALKDALGLDTREPETLDGKGLWNQFKGVVSDALGFGAALLQFGKTFFQMGSILLGIGIMGTIRKSLEKWNNYDSSKSTKNIKNTLIDLKDAFGLTTHKPEKLDGKGLWNQVKGVMSDALGFGATILQFGKTFFQMGSIFLAMGMMNKVRDNLEKWDNYDSKSAIGNIKITLESLKDTLGLNTREPETLDGKGLWNQLKGVGSDIIGFGATVIQFGKMFFQMGSIFLGMGMMNKTRDVLEKWNDYDSSGAIKNIRDTLYNLKDTLGLNTREPETLDGKGLWNQLKGLTGDVLGFGAAILQFGKSFFQMGSIFLGMGMMNKVRDNLEKWNDYDSSSAIGNIRNTISNLKEVMGLINNNEEKEENTTEQKAKWYERVWEGIKNTGKKISTVASGVANGIKSMAKLSGMVDFTSAMAEIKDYLSPYDNYDSSKSIGNIRNTVIDLLSVVKDGDASIKRSNAFKKTSEHIKDGLKDLEKGFKNIKTIQTVHEPIDKTVKSINMLDLEKATVMTDMFKSFAKIGNRPLNKFTDAVNRFVKSCGELIGSMNRLSDSNESIDRTQEVVVDNSTNGSPKNNGSFYIENTKDLAQAIAEAIKSLPINVENNMSDIRLVVDGTSGKKVILSLE